MREVTDGDFPFADEWNAVAGDALTGTSVAEGCAVSDGGSNDLALQVASGAVNVDSTRYQVSSQSVSLQSADPDHDRYDLVVVGSDGTAEAMTGTPSPTPQAPSIPDGHVLLAIVEVPAGVTGVTDADVFDARAVVSDDMIPTTDPIYGDGSDGAITRSSDGSENGVVNATEYVVEPGVTRSVTNGVLVVQATRSITIDGRLTATGYGASAGGGGGGGWGDSATRDDQDGSSGASGTNGAVSGSGTGGASRNSIVSDGNPGSAGGGGSGGSGDDTESYWGYGGYGGDAGGTNFSATQFTKLRTYLSPAYDSVLDLSMLAGAGGGGGGGGGGGDQAEDDGGRGGDGGDGGGVVLLVAPVVRVNGTVAASGTDGGDGGDGSSDGGGAGGGGGGSGGAVLLVSPDVETPGTVDVSGGVGGSGGVSPGGGGDGARGGDGEPGIQYELST
jgi:hypothetical protein